MPANRRDFLRSGTWGLAAAGVAGVVLRADAVPTETSGEPGGQSPSPFSIPAVPSPTALKATEDNILGPYHRRGAPFRAKITPPLEPGETLVIRGRVWSFESKKPLAGATLDIWQANASGRYDNDDPAAPPQPGVYVNRARLVTDESGYYEYETIKPGRYQIGDNQWRPAHIHYLVEAAGHKSLVTQLYFRGDPYNDKDRFIKPSLIIDPQVVKTRGGTFLLGDFDVVLAGAKR
jgi:protocatechuate 3,4-dioxygenase beta subunit